MRSDSVINVRVAFLPVTDAGDTDTLEILSQDTVVNTKRLLEATHAYGTQVKHLIFRGGFPR